MSKKYKITPLGYLLLLILIISTLFLVARSVQSRSPITSLIYRLNHTEMDYASGTMKLSSEGDAINLAIKDIEFNFESSNNYIHLSGLLKRNQVELPAFDSFFNHEKLLFKTSFQNEYIEMNYNDLYLLTDSSYDYHIEDFLEALHDNPSIYSLIKKHPLIFSRLLKPYTIQNNKEIIIALTFDDLFNIIDELIVELHNDEYMQHLLLTYLMDYYNIYEDLGNNVTSQDLTLWQEDFTLTLEKKINSFKRVVLKEYDKLSEIELIFEGQKNIETMILKGKFFYNHCDAYEDLYVEINKSDSITPYPEMINSQLKPNLTLFKTLLKLYQ